MTARSNLELQADELGLDEDEQFQEPYYFYDNEENYWTLRQERDDMPTRRHNKVVEYLKQVLVWQYRKEAYIIDREINFYETLDRMEKPLYPDVFVLKTQTEFPEGSYRLGIDGPPPQLLIEIISKNTPGNDLKKKPPRYEAWGVAEYFVYDPRPRKRNLKRSRLTGWRLVEGKYQKLTPNSAGRIWSEQLDSWLMPDGEMLRLFDREGNQRLTEAEERTQENLTSLRREEATRWEKELAEQRAAAALQREEAERRAKEVALQQAETERQAKETALQREAVALQQLETERQVKETLQREIEQMAENLRRLE